MIAKHDFMVHAACPFVNGVFWDYYTITIFSERVIDVLLIDKLLNTFRGMTGSQEAVTLAIAAEVFKLGACRVESTGSHFAYTNSKVEIINEVPARQLTEAREHEEGSPSGGGSAVDTSNQVP